MASTSRRGICHFHSFSGSLLRSFWVSTSRLTPNTREICNRHASGGVARRSSYAPIADCFSPSFSANCFWVRPCRVRRNFRFELTIVTLKCPTTQNSPDNKVFFLSFQFHHFSFSGSRFLPTVFA